MPDLILTLLHAAIALAPHDSGATQDAIRAAIGLYDSGVMEPAPDPAAPCPHPPPSRQSCGTLADPDAFLCRDCGHIEQKEPPPWLTSSATRS